MKLSELIPEYNINITSEGMYTEGYCRVDEYSSDVIAFRLKKKRITVMGRRLTLAAIDKSQMLITGIIQNLQIDEAGELR